MVDLIAEREGDTSYVTYLPELEAEYEYWMDGSAVVRGDQGYRRVVRLSDGTIFNRYWDDRAEPRDESYRIKGDSDRSSHFAALAVRRLMWNERSHAFTDYAWQRHKALPVTAAGLFPLFLHVANQHQAEMEAQTVRRKLLMPGGIATTLVVSGQQWDHPNGWAPLQWIAVVGLKNYNEVQLAETIAKRWSCENIDGYQMSRILVEKYNLVNGSAGGIARTSRRPSSVAEIREISTATFERQPNRDGISAPDGSPMAIASARSGPRSYCRWT
jgi:neutral trehalase